MKPIRTEETNVILELPGGTRANDLPVIRGKDHEDRQVWRSTWQPDPLELEHLIHGAPIQVDIWGDRHPPIAVRTGNVAAGEVAGLTANHIALAIGYFHASLEQRLTTGIAAALNKHAPAASLTTESGQELGAGAARALGYPDPDQFFAMWALAVAHTAEAAALSNAIDTIAHDGHPPNNDRNPTGDATDPRQTPPQPPETA